VDVAKGGTVASKALVLDGNADLTSLQTVNAVVAGSLSTTGTAALGATTITGACSVSTTLTATGGLVFPDTGASYVIGIFTYDADPNSDTATITATGVRTDDIVIGGAQIGAINGTFKVLEAATPGTDEIVLKWETDPGAAVRHSFLVLR